MELAAYMLRTEVYVTLGSSCIKAPCDRSYFVHILASRNPRGVTHVANADCIKTNAAVSRFVSLRGGATLTSCRRVQLPEQVMYRLSCVWLRKRP